MYSLTCYLPQYSVTLWIKCILLNQASKTHDLPLPSYSASSYTSFLLTHYHSSCGLFKKQKESQVSLRVILLDVCHPDILYPLTSPYFYGLVLCHSGIILNVFQSQIPNLKSSSSYSQVTSCYFNCGIILINTAITSLCRISWKILLLALICLLLKQHLEQYIFLK